MKMEKHLHIFNMIVHLSLVSALFLCLFSSCSPSTRKNEVASASDSLQQENSDSSQIKQLIWDYNLNQIDTFAVGDVDGDGNNDQAIIQPLTFFYRNNQMDSQYVKIAFTCSIPAIKHYNGFKGLIANVGDLDGNHTDEVAYCPDWYQSNAGGIYIYGYRQNKWTLFGSGSIRRDVIREQKDPIEYLKNRIKRINNHSFYLTQSVWNADVADFIDSAIIVTIQ
jgi:hypothetical protein